MTSHDSFRDTFETLSEDLKSAYGRTGRLDPDKQAKAFRAADAMDRILTDKNVLSEPACWITKNKESFYIVIHLYEINSKDSLWFYDVIRSVDAFVIAWDEDSEDAVRLILFVNTYWEAE